MRFFKKKYDFHIHWDLTNRCNYDCVYCEIKDKKTAEIREIDVKRLLDSLNKTKKIFRINFAGGEPFLIPNFVEACKEITKKHYIGVITNLSHPAVIDFMKQINPKKVISILCSAHIDELLSRKSLDEFCKRVRSLQKIGFNVIVNSVAHPKFLNKINYYWKMFHDRGVSLGFQLYKGVDEKTGKVYPMTYTKEELKKIGHPPDSNNFFYGFKGKKCYAGNLFAFVDSETRIYPCHDFHINSIEEKRLYDKIVNPESKIHLGNNSNPKSKKERSLYDGIEFKDPIICPFEFCHCPIHEWDFVLFPKPIKVILKEKINKTNVILKEKINKTNVILKEKINKINGKIGLAIKKISPNLYYILGGKN